MAIWDDVSNFFSGGGRDDVEQGYRDAGRYLEPYQRGGVEDYNRMRDYTSRWGNNLDSYGNPGDWAYKQINQSPTDYYNNIMKGYSESPEAKYEQEQALRASSAGASASGMLGSGAFQKGIQQNAADISNRDRDRYFGNVMTSNNAQMGYLNNLQNQRAQQLQLMQYLTQMGYGAGNNMAGNAIDRGNSMARFDQSMFDDLAGLAGGAARGGWSYYNRPQYAR